MFATLKNAFKVKEIRTRLLFVLLVLVVVRIGSQLPVPGIDRDFFSSWFDKFNSGDYEGTFDFFDAITGGSFFQMSIFALGINPYITSSIIIQLLTIAIPKLEELQRDGEEGRKKITTITRYLTVGLAIVQASAMAIGFGNQGVISGGTWYNKVLCIFALTAGSAFLMWIGEQITEHGIGNGISIVLTINILSRIPDDIKELYLTKIEGKAVATAVLIALIIIAIFIAMVVLVIILNDAVRYIPVQYSKSMRGRKQMGGSNSSIPLKINTSGVIPIIFAQSLFQFPTIITSFVKGGNSADGTTWGEVIRYFNTRNWCQFTSVKEIKYSAGMLLYIALVIFFAYFYTSITFNPIMVSDNLKKQGGFIPGIRPGKPTSDYLNKVLNRIVFIGAVGLIIVCILPYFFSGVFNVSISTAGTSLIIIVSVIIETLKQVESMMLVRNYKGFLEN